MRSPRFLRPHRIIVRNRLGENDGEAQYQETCVCYVCADAAYGIQQSQKGIQGTGDLLVVFDMNDIVAFEDTSRRVYAGPVEFEQMKDTSGYFTLRPDVDLIVYKDHEYTINTVGEVNPIREEPEFMEVTANE